MRRRSASSDRSLQESTLDTPSRGREFGDMGPDSAEYQWILDPVEGTAAFTLGMPLFGTLIGILRNGKPVVGVVRFPELNETLYTAQGSGCWHQIDITDPVLVPVSAKTCRWKKPPSPPRESTAAKSSPGREKPPTGSATRPGRQRRSGWEGIVIFTACCVRGGRTL